jgi:rhodanese-related sulfurtransferase
MRKVLALLVFFCCTTLPLQAVVGLQAAPRQYGKVDTKGVEILLRSGLPVVFLDARKARFDDGKRLPGARLMAPDASASQIARVVPNKNTLVVTYCSHMRCPLSHELAESLNKMGYKNVLVYPYGLKGWTTAGNKLEASSR